jgi:hypothetical protein
MDCLTLDQKINEILATPDLEKYIDLSAESFFVSKILFIPKKITTTAELIKLVDMGKKIKIIQVIDEKNNNNLIFNSCGHLFINNYTRLIDKLQDDFKLGFYEKKKQVLGVIFKLKKFTKAHNINSRFSFASKNILTVQCTDGEIQIDYNSLQLSLEQINTLREMFLIRQEIFQELLNLTDNYLDYLDYNSYKYSEFKIEPDSGKFLLYSFIWAFETENKFLNLQTAELEQLTKIIFQLFGIAPPEFGDLRGALLKRKKDHTKELDIIVRIIEKRLNQHKLLTKK